MAQPTLSRRSLLAGLGAGTAVLPTFMGAKAQAADVSGYKALVCVFLFGGLDCHELLIPFDAPSHEVDGTGTGVVEFNPLAVWESIAVVGGVWQEFGHLNVADLTGHEFHWKWVHPFGRRVGGVGPRYVGLRGDHQGEALNG